MRRPYVMKQTEDYLTRYSTVPAGIPRTPSGSSPKRSEWDPMCEVVDRQVSKGGLPNIRLIALMTTRPIQLK